MPSDKQTVNSDEELMQLWKQMQDGMDERDLSRLAQHTDKAGKTLPTDEKMQEEQRISNNAIIGQKKTESDKVETKIFYREVAGKLFDAIAQRFMVQPPADDREAIINWATEYIDPKHISGIGPESGQKNRATGRDGLAGNRQAVSLQILSRVEELGGDLDNLMDFFVAVVAPTFARLEAEGAATPENFVDLVVKSFSSVSPGTHDILGDPAWLSAFVPGLRGYLDNQSVDQREHGYYQTRSSLAMWLGRNENARTCRFVALFYYHELLSLGPETCGKRVFHIAANNLAGGIAEFWRDSTQKPAPHHQEMFSLLQALATAAALEDEEDNGLEYAGFWKELGFSLPDSVAYRGVTILKEMANVASSWAVVGADVLKGPDVVGRVPGEAESEQHGEDWMVVMDVMAALARMAFNKDADWDEIAAAFFNAGVAFVRLDRKGAVIPRIALNGAGLGWALTRGENMGQALSEFHGLDCVVNLFGAITELPANKRQGIAEACRTLAGQLFAPDVRAVVPQHEQMEYRRLQGSLKELGLSISAPSTEEVSVRAESMLAALDGILDSLGSGLPAFRGSGQENSLELAIRTGKALAPLLKKELGEEYDKHLQSLSRLVRVIAEWGDALDTAWRRFYSSPLADQFDGKGNRTVLGKGAPVAAGLMSEEEWRALAKQSVVPVKHISEWLQSRLKGL